MKELKSRRYFQVIWANYAGVDVLRELALSQSAVNDNIMVSTSEMLTVDHLLHIVDFYHPVFVRQLMMTAILMQQRQLTSSRRCQDTSDPRHFGPKTVRHHCDGAEVSGHFGTGDVGECRVDRAMFFTAVNNKRSSCSEPSPK